MARWLVLTTFKKSVALGQALEGGHGQGVAEPFIFRQHADALQAMFSQLHHGGGGTAAVDEKCPALLQEPR